MYHYYTESINPNACMSVLSLNMRDFFLHFPSRKDKSKEDIYSGRDYYKRVKSILNCFKTNKFSQNVKYQHSSFNQQAGRLFGKNSIQNFDGRLRRYLTTGVYRDYDMINAHPNILRKICAENNIDCPLLSNYCENRSKFLEENEVTKSNILMLLNVDKPYNLKQYTPEVQRFLGELSEIKQKLYLKFKNDFKTKEDSKNKISSLINIKLCDEENKLLQDALSKVDKEQVGVLMFDGFMTKQTIQTSILDTEYIKWTEKENTSDVEIDDYHQPIDEELTYESKKKEWECDWNGCKILYPPCFMVDIGGISREYLLSGLKQSFSHMDCVIPDKDGGDPKPVSFIDMWRDDKNAQIKQSICNVPHTLPQPNEQYNLWRKFDVMLWDRTDYEYDKEASDFFFNHIKEIITNNDENMYQFVVKWIAHLFQKPHLKTGVCLITTGEKGTGKDTAINFISAMMGDGKVFETIEPEKDVYGSFNSQVRDCLLVHISEIGKGNTFGHMGKIKSLITSNNFQVKTKNVPNYVIKSLHNYWILSNDNDPVPTEKGQRRFVHSISSPKRKGDFAYFTKMHSLISNKNALISIYEDLMKIPNVPDLFTEKDLVFSSYQKTLMEDAEPYEHQFLKFYSNQQIQSGIEKSKRIYNKDLYGCFEEFMIDKFGKCLMNKIRFGKLVMATVSTYPDSFTVGSSNGRYIVIDFKALLQNLGDDNIYEIESNNEIIEDI